MRNMNLVLLLRIIMTFAYTGGMNPDIAMLESILVSDPDDLVALVNLGKHYIDAKRFTEALPLLRRSVAQHPDVFLAQNYLADAIYLLRQPRNAILHYEIALQLRPGDVDVLTNLSVCHWQIGDYLNAHRYAKLNRAQRPVNFALMSLLIGDYTEGWKYWDNLDTATSVNLPRWTGEMTDKHILVLDEDQGFGDTIALVRFLPMLRDRCKKVTFQTRSTLRRLMHLSFPNIEVIDTVVQPQQYDLEIRLFSLPRLFEVHAEKIPQTPYLRADATDRLTWQHRLSHQDGLKVGLRWSGSSDYPMDHVRSISDLAVLEPLRDVAGVSYTALTKERGTLPDIAMLFVGDDLTDFADTAALLMSLDLVISTDTSVINLAGALGVPTWLMNYQMDWRWGIDAEYSPWYPSIRVFRQTTLGDWRSVIDLVKARLILCLQDARMLL
jgi:hypothetical protein